MEKDLIYHGTSDVFLPKILKEGFLLPRSEGKYDEVRREFSKYVSPEVLTDAFFDKHIDRMPSGRDLGMTPGLRIRQVRRGHGIFYSNSPIEPQRYANSTMKNGGGEFERNVLGILENIPQSLAEVQEGERYALNNKDVPLEVMKELQLKEEMYHTLQDNIKPEFLNEQGQFQAPSVSSHQKAIVFEIEIEGNTLGENDGRLNESVSLSQIKRIGYANTDERVPISFMTVEDFLKDNLRRQQSGEHFSYNPAQVLADYWKARQEQKGVAELSDLRKEVKQDTLHQEGQLFEEEVTTPEFLINKEKTSNTSGQNVSKVEQRIPQTSHAKNYSIMSLLSFFQKRNR